MNKGRVLEFKSKQELEFEDDDREWCGEYLSYGKDLEVIAEALDHLETLEFKHLTTKELNDLIGGNNMTDLEDAMGVITNVIRKRSKILAGKENINQEEI